MEWWRKAVFYQIYPRSFMDADGDGAGDLRGISSRIDYLHDTLGVDAVWLSPVYSSPMVDNGYDVRDYRAIDPLFGSMADLEELISALHARDMRLIMDWIPNHTSSECDWFRESRRSTTNRYRDWYVWRDGAAPGEPPNNWKSFFPRVGPAWTFDDVTGQWYLHSFMADQPDLNWDNPEVEAAMHDVISFWLEKGVDGFRIDALPLIGKDPLLRSNADTDIIWGENNIDWPSVHERIRRLRALSAGFPGDRILVGEVNIRELSRLALYLRERDELQLAHNFLFLQQPWQAPAIQAFIDDVHRHIAGPALPAWYLGNHDDSRVVTRLAGGPWGAAQARIAALLLLTIRGAPFIYQGEELGLPDSDVPADRLHDVGGREAQRAPMPWVAPSTTPSAGFTTGTPWLPVHRDAETLNVAAQVNDPDSMLSLYRDVLAVRRANPALHSGEYRRLTAHPDTVAYLRSAPDCEAVVILNFGGQTLTLTLIDDLPARSGQILVSTDPGRKLEGTDLATITLGPVEGIVIELDRLRSGQGIAVAV